MTDAESDTGLARKKYRGRQVVRRGPEVVLAGMPPART